VAPTWKTEHGNELFLSLTEYRRSASSESPASEPQDNDPTHILIELWNSNLAVDDFIGSVAIPVDAALEAPIDTVHKLELNTGGHVFVKIAKQGNEPGRGSFLSGSGLQNSFMQVPKA
jgi:hypothetical protein